MIETASRHESLGLDARSIAVWLDPRPIAAVPRPEHRQEGGEYPLGRLGLVSRMKALSRMWYYLALAITLIVLGVGWSSPSREPIGTFSLPVAASAAIHVTAGYASTSSVPVLVSDESECSGYCVKALEAEADGEDAPIDALPWFASSIEVGPVVLSIDQSYARERALSAAHFLISTGPPRGPPASV